ncbi:acyl-CoA dehydrogenase family protein [Nocardioides pantholopis]|uniref:acyl-CoA dehydrogenase family protein n=1 Tax=Nocardioides pantholopis TaxID=2483798 RepID=UPI000F08101D|nr:acyl-CoA dehydrogenase family protein [Nocardioides pantholopis]
MAEPGTDEEEFVFTDEHRALRTAVRRFCGAHRVRGPVELDGGYDARVWRRLSSELGVLGLAVPEPSGGGGGTLIDQAIAVEELGAALAAGPVVGTVLLAIPLLAAAPPHPARDQLLARLCSGEATAATVLTGSPGGLESTPVDAIVAPDEDGWTLSAALGAVPDAGAADVLLVAVPTPEGTAVVAIDTDQPGVERTPLVTLDLTRPQARVRLTDVFAHTIVEPPHADAAARSALHTAGMLLAAEQVGAGQHLLDLTVDHARTRRQFGRQIGSFQAVKHRLADMLVAVEHARSTAYHAAWALATGSDDPALAVSIAQATCSPALSRVAADTIQLHGGIGFTWEHQAHLYFKRAAADAALLGTTEAHRDRVARVALDLASADGAPPIADGLPHAAVRP